MSIDGSRIKKLARGLGGTAELAFVQTRNQGNYVGVYNGADDPIDPLSLLVKAKKGMIGVDLYFNIAFGAGNYEGGWVVTRDGVLLPDSVDGVDSPWSIISGIPVGTVHTSWITQNNIVQIRDKAPLIGVEVLYELRKRRTGTNGQNPIYLNYGGATPQNGREAMMSSSRATGVYRNA